MVDFDWQHMFTYVTEHLNNFNSPIKKSTEAISYATVSKYARQELTSGNLKKNSLSLNSENRWGTQEKKQRENQKVVLTNSHTIPSILQ